MQVQVLKKKKSAVKLAAVFYVIALAFMPMFVYAQTNKAGNATGNATSVVSTDFWKGVATNAVTFMKTTLAIAFWGSLALLLVYAVISWIGPTKFTRLGALYDFVDTIKSWLLATFVIAAGIVGLIAGFTAITGAFGAQANISPVNVLTDLLIKPVQNLIGITQG
ncbi:MAG: hypothetical protein QXP31_03665 [Pyrobaculum sp.]